MAKSLRKKSVRKNSKTSKTSKRSKRSKQRRSRKMRGGELCESIEAAIKNGNIEDFDELKTMINEDDLVKCKINNASLFNEVKNEVKVGFEDVYSERKDKNLNPSQKRMNDSSHPQPSGRGVGPMRQN